MHEKAGYMLEKHGFCVKLKWQDICCVNQWKRMQLINNEITICKLNSLNSFSSLKSEHTFKRATNQLV